FVDGADADSNPFNEPVRVFSLHELYSVNDPTAKILMIHSAAGWCGPDMMFTSELNAIADDYAASGVRVIQTVFDDASGDPANEAFVAYWGNQFYLRIPTLIDSQFQLGPYYSQPAQPMVMFVDLTTMKILEITIGFPGVAYYRARLDLYLA